MMDEKMKELYKEVLGLSDRVLDDIDDPTESVVLDTSELDWLPSDDIQSILSTFDEGTMFMTHQQVDSKRELLHTLVADMEEDKVLFGFTMSYTEDGPGNEVLVFKDVR